VGVNESHPPTSSEPARAEEFDVVVLGAGPAGEVCAGRLGEAGASVALVERELVGGECSFYACMPSKGLLRPAQALAEARRVRGAAEAVSGPLDVSAVLARRDEIIHSLDDEGQLPWVREHGIELVRGSGQLDGERRVRVGSRVLIARRAVVLAPGSRAAIPPIPGLAEAAPWTNRQATTSERIPSSLLVLGGGVVAVELAQAYATLGARVALLEVRERLIAREEPFASELVREALERSGVEVVLGAKASRVEPGPALVLEDGRTLAGEQLLVAVGRTPNTEQIGLESIGLEGRGHIDVDECFRVPGHDWLYAIGDVNGHVLLTHMGKRQARLVAETILRGGEDPVESGSRGDAGTRGGADGADRDCSPRVIFTEPQVAAVGHTLASAHAAGLDVRAVDQPLANAGESFVGHGARGEARIVIDNERHLIVGATFVGVEVAEWLHAATIAIVGAVPLAVLADAVPAFPTRSEVWLGLLQKALA
jgi:pyruvate/2-oxoglutarate dehydrogenase complex dihydrolipoamide dehydrogenase (E3) component